MFAILSGCHALYKQTVLHGTYIETESLSFCQPVGGVSQSEAEVQHGAWQRRPCHDICCKCSDECIEVLCTVFGICLLNVSATHTHTLLKGSKNTTKLYIYLYKLLLVWWMSLHKIASEWAVDSGLQRLHQLSFVIQQLLPFSLDKVCLPKICVQASTQPFISSVAQWICTVFFSLHANF